MDELKINSAIAAHRQSSFRFDLVEFASDRLAVPPHYFEHNVRMRFLDHLEFPYPRTKVEQKDEVSGVNERLISLAEHIHDTAGYVLEHLRPRRASVPASLRQQRAAISDPITEERHRVIGEAGHHDVALGTRWHWMACVVHDLNIVTPRSDPKTLESRQFAGDVTHFARTVHVINFAAEHLLNLLPHEWIKVPG